MGLPTPEYYSPEDVGRIYVERGQEIAGQATRYRELYGIPSAVDDGFRIAAFGIDVQLGFCHPDASLFVPGAPEDTGRFLAWFYAHLDRITGLFFSLDTHRVFQIFHPSWWRDAEGESPPPLTVIRAADIEAGTWRAAHHPEASLAYCKALEASGKYVLTIWPYHTLLGGVSHALVPAVMEASIFHSIARETQSHFEIKGTHPQTENYSVFSPEVQQLGEQRLGGFNEALFGELMSFDRIYVFGQASSHCVLSTLQDLQRQIEGSDPSAMGKIWILEDAMSPVPAPPLEPLPAALDFPAVAKAALDGFREAGMQVVKTTDAIEEAPSAA